MNKIIFRETYNEYWGCVEYLAIFPRWTANIGMVEILSFRPTKDGYIFDPHDEASIDYLLDQKIIHKTDSRIPELLQAVERYHNDKYEVREKITRTDDRERYAWIKRRIECTN